MVRICEQNVHIGQLRLSVAQVEEMLGMAQGWLEQLHHLADHAHKPEASAGLARVTVSLGEARSALERAIEDLDAPAGSGGVSVEVV